MENAQEIEERDYRTALGAVANSGLKTYVSAIHTLENVVKIMRHNRVERASKGFTPKVLHKMVADEIKWLMARTREMRDAELLRNDEMRTKGTPFVERMKIINSRKIEWCDQEETRLSRLLSSFRVRPLAEWFDEVDYDAAKEMGMAWVIRLKLDSIAIHG